MSKKEFLRRMKLVKMRIKGSEGGKVSCAFVQDYLGMKGLYYYWFYIRPKQVSFLNEKANYDEKLFLRYFIVDSFEQEMISSKRYKKIPALRIVLL